jgi:signal peptidase I
MNSFIRQILRVSFGKNPKLTFLRLVLIALLSFLIFRYLLLPVRIAGESMEPTYRNNSINFIYTLKYSECLPDYGDIVAVSMAGRRVMLLKRVVALPSDTVAFQDGQLYINDRLKKEPYLVYDSDWDMEQIKLESDEFFVVGDNRSMPKKNHAFGRVKLMRIIGAPLL